MPFKGTMKLRLVRTGSRAKYSVTRPSIVSWMSRNSVFDEVEGGEKEKERSKRVFILVCTILR